MIPTEQPVEPKSKWPGVFMAVVVSVCAVATAWAVVSMGEDDSDDDVILTPRDEEDPAVEDTDMFVLKYLEGTEGWERVCREFAGVSDMDSDALRQITIDSFEEGYGDLSPAGEAELWRMIQDC